MVAVKGLELARQALKRTADDEIAGALVSHKSDAQRAVKQVSTLIQTELEKMARGEVTLFIEGVQALPPRDSPDWIGKTRNLDVRDMSRVLRIRLNVVNERELGPHSPVKLAFDYALSLRNSEPGKIGQHRVTEDQDPRYLLTLAMEDMIQRDFGSPLLGIFASPGSRQVDLFVSIPA